ncbi:roadblock/LC7 domain-containing protein [Streptomyces qinglanensis]|uniref:Roadblock/LC7 domain-containing protein n=1 Tax=Streptomyces qinglanensis TaxID=943816 RepID=A0A1H9V6T8_9ACTN|nr:roadblock/LC7 domain-containing protein [Streptomyces qinglanensis]SES16957.1 Roadblock/LC7 domain-containing protein [Streptomyces qinglanensis]
MNPLNTGTSGSAEARNLRWLLGKLVEEVPGIRSVAVVSSDGLLLLASDPALGVEHGSSALGTGYGRSVVGAEQGRRQEQHAGLREQQPVYAGQGAGAPAAVREEAGTTRAGIPVRRRRGGRPAAGPRGTSGDLAALVSGVASLTFAAAELMEAGVVKQTIVSMDEGALLVMAIGDGSLLGVHAAADCDMAAVGYQMGLFVGRAGHVLTPELRSELRGAVGAGAGR